MYLIKRYLFHFWRLICFFELWIFISSWVRERQRDCHVSCVWSGVEWSGFWQNRFILWSIQERNLLRVWNILFISFFLFSLSTSLHLCLHPFLLLLTLSPTPFFLPSSRPSYHHSLLSVLPSSLSVSCLLTRLLCPNPKLTRELFCLAAPPPPPLNLPALFLNLYHFLSSIFV